MESHAAFGRLSDRELTSEIARLALRERESVTELVACIEEFDRRRVFLPLGYSSMFAYCTEQLRLGEGAAYRRIQAARAARRFPVILEHLREGRVTLTTITLIAAHLTTANHESLLAEVAHKSKDDVRLVVARLRPLPDAPTIVRRVSAPSQPEMPAHVPSPAPVAASNIPEDTVRPNAIAPAVRPPVIAPLTTERFKIQVTVGREAHDNLRQLQALMRHSIPTGDAARIIERALALLLKEVQRKKFGLLSGSRKTG